MTNHSCSRSGLTRLWALLGVVALLAFGLSAPAYAAKPSGTTDGSTTAAKGPDHSSGNASTVGDPKKPQPYSGADQNNTGANDTSDTNQYRSTRHGEASGNGNGGGNATGKPAAGSVGKADNKNPPGQYPNGSDHNNGYECDGNNGIAKENPAHTGCQPTTPPTECTPTPGHPCTPPTECTPTEGHPCTPPTECTPTEGHPCTPPTECIPTAGNPCTPPTECTPTEGNPCTPPTGCVAGNPYDNPATTTVECDVVSPPTGCIGDCGTVVSPPRGGEAAPPSSTTTSSPAASVLPQTGAGSGLLGAALLGLLLAFGGVVITARVRARA